MIADAKQIWLVTGDNDLFRIDPREKRIVGELRLTSGGEVNMALLRGSLWIDQTGIRCTTWTRDGRGTRQWAAVG